MIEILGCWKCGAKSESVRHGLVTRRSRNFKRFIQYYVECRDCGERIAFDVGGGPGEMQSHGERCDALRVEWNRKYEERLFYDECPVASEKRTPTI